MKLINVHSFSFRIYLSSNIINKDVLFTEFVTNSLFTYLKKNTKIDAWQIGDLNIPEVGSGA